MHLLRYAWSVLLLVAAMLAPDPATTITLLVAGLCTVVLAVSREKRMQRLVRELTHLLDVPLHTQTKTTISLERNLLAMQRTLLTLAAIAELVVLAALLFANLDVTTARNYALLVLVALAPLGLELELAVLIHRKHTHTSETVRTAVGYALEDAYTLLAIIGMSLVGTLWLHIPPALSALQILIITCVARPLISGRTLQATPHKTERRWRVLFASLTVYGSFVFFFIRHYLDPRYADVVNPVTWQATTIAMLTFIACQVVLPLFNPKLPNVARYRFGLLLGILAVLIYVPFFQNYLMTGGPDVADWVWILVSSLFFTALVMLRRYTTEHSREKVLS